LVGYLTKKFFIGVFPQQWWSIGGEHGRRDTNQMNLQPIATIFFGDGWSLGSLLFGMLNALGQSG
jgi:hypothetical protein